jgi:alkylation response protein AidB-like acyl-CoA dehydrogenase
MPISVEEFRQQARGWLAQNAPLAADRAGAGMEGFDPATVPAQKALQRRIFDAGLAGITWPTRYGGQGLSDEHQLAFNEEAARYALPGLWPVGFGMCGPTILDLGTEAQKQFAIEPMLRGDTVWCQLFSEPNAGSDVAGLRTRAERDGDEWVINGQKVWTSGAHVSDFGCLLARTDPSVPKHNGITMFILDMHAPGVTVRPLKQMTGEAPFNEVFFDNVRIPNDMIVGEENAGWAAAVLMLRHERISIGTSARSPERPLSYESVLSFARKVGRTADPLVRDRLAHLYAIDTAGNLQGQRMRQEVDAGQELRARGSIPKLAGSVIARGAIDVLDEVGGADVIAWDAGAAFPTPTYGVIEAPGHGIGGGSNEIQRGIIGERVLGLAKDPQLDREIPFNELRPMIAAPPTR